MSKEKKKHLSPTQLGMYLRCGEQYRRRYIEGERIPPGIALIKGSSVHKGAEHNFRQKISTKEDLPIEDIRDAAATHFSGQLSNGYELSPEEKAVGHQKVLGDAKDSMIRLVDLFAGFVSPRIQPVMVEHIQYIDLPRHQFDLMSIIDVATVDSELVDLKTSSRKKAESDAHDSDQLSWQAMAYNKLTGKYPKNLALEVVIDTGKSTNHQKLTTKRGEKDTEILLNKINSMIAGVNAGIFLPAEPGSWICSPRWCGYWDSCPYVNQERRIAAEKGA